MTLHRDRTTPNDDFGRPIGGARRWLHDVIFGIHTPAGRAFDIALITMIAVSVLVVMVDSVGEVHARYGRLFDTLEWVFTAAFTVEYLARLYCVQRPARYARSFFGVVDLLAIVPTYVALLAPAVSVLVDVRVLRLLRVFRVLRLGKFVAEFGALGRALGVFRSRHKPFYLQASVSRQVALSCPSAARICSVAQQTLLGRVPTHLGVSHVISVGNIATAFSTAAVGFPQLSL